MSVLVGLFTSSDLVKQKRICSISTIVAIISIWFASFLLITLFAWDRHLTTNRQSIRAETDVHRDNTNRRTGGEPLEEFLERNDICNSPTEMSHINVSMFNETVRTFCRALLKVMFYYTPNKLYRYQDTITIIFNYLA